MYRRLIYAGCLSKASSLACAREGPVITSRSSLLAELKTRTVICEQRYERPGLLELALGDLLLYSRQLLGLRW